jgi:hypothetical protein
MVMPEFKSTTVCNARSSFEACARSQEMTASYHNRVCVLQFFGAFSMKTYKNAPLASPCLSLHLSIDLYAHDSKTAERVFMEFDI